MKVIRKAVLAVAVATTLIACAREGRHQEPTAVPASPQPMSNLPPVYFGPAYSAAAVYTYVRPSAPTPSSSPTPSSPRL